MGSRGAGKSRQADRRPLDTDSDSEFDAPPSSGPQNKKKSAAASQPVKKRRSRAVVTETSNSSSESESCETGEYSLPKYSERAHMLEPA